MRCCVRSDKGGGSRWAGRRGNDDDQIRAAAVARRRIIPSCAPKKSSKCSTSSSTKSPRAWLKAAAVELRGFGTFSTRQRDGRTGRNPRTGAPVDVPAKKVPYFKPGKEDARAAQHRLARPGGARATVARRFASDQRKGAEPAGSAPFAVGPLARLRSLRSHRQRPSARQAGHAGDQAERRGHVADGLEVVLVEDVLHLERDLPVVVLGASRSGGHWRGTGRGFRPTMVFSALVKSLP